MTDAADFRRELEAWRSEWFSPSTTVTLQTSGSTGKPKPVSVEKAAMKASAERTCRFFNLREGDATLLCMPLKYVAGRMVCVRAWTHGLRLVCVPPTLHPFAELTAPPAMAAITPAQAFESLRESREAELMRRTRVVLIGGGEIRPELARMLSDADNAWSSYGMTETLSHIALRRLSPTSDEAYTPLEGVRVDLDARGCLVVSDALTGVGCLATNDCATILPDGRFRITGRIDNVVCSGGLKWHLEELEARLASLNIPLMLTAVPDARLGQALVLLHLQGVPTDELRTAVGNLLPRHARPRHYIALNTLPLTPTGKPARHEAMRLARTLLKLS